MARGTTFNISRRTLLSGMAGVATLAVTSCALPASGGQQDPSSADELTGARLPIDSFDMHADTIDVLGMRSHAPYASFNNKFSGDLADTNAQISANRMGEVRWAQCYAIWIPDAEGDVQGDIPAIEWYREGVAWFKRQMEEQSDTFAQVRKFSDIPSILDEGKVAAILTVENAACLDAGLEVVDEFERDGVLIAGVTWNYKNVLGSGNEYPEQGLSQLGREYVAALEEHGIVADVSHLNEKGFWELDEIATKPYVATHSNARSVCGHLRNLTDEQFGALTARGGVVGLNFHEGFVHDGGYAYTFDELSAHVDHWLSLGGEDHIALGSDRDGADVPTWLADCSGQQALFERFEERFGLDVTRKLFYENALRFFSSVS